MRTFGCIALSALVLALLVACAPAQPASRTTASSTASAAVSLPSGRASLTSPASAPRPSQNVSSAGGLCGYPTAPPQDAGVLTINNISPVDFAPWEAFLGAVNLGETVIVNRASDALEKQLARHGYRLRATPLDEFLKAGGSAKCLTLRLDEPGLRTAA